MKQIQRSYSIPVTSARHYGGANVGGQLSGLY